MSRFGKAFALSCVLFLSLLLLTANAWAAAHNTTTAITGTTPGTTTTLGQAVTFTATVTDTHGGGSSPFGNVLFYTGTITDSSGNCVLGNDVTLLGSASLSAAAATTSTATFTTADIPVGTPTITACYINDGTNSWNNSDNATGPTQTVTARNSTTVITAPPAGPTTTGIGVLNNVTVTITDDHSNGPTLAGTTPGNFKATGSLPATRAYAGGTLLPEGTVLIAGGVRGGATVNTCAVYNPGAGTFSGKLLNGATNCPTLANVRAGFTMTTLQDGTVLVTGGSSAGLGAGSSLNTAETWDPKAVPATNFANVTGPGSTMAHKRINHTATLLPNGDVLILGGTGSAGTPRNDADVWSGGSFVVTASTMTTARAGHTATLIGANATTATILVAGGDNAGDSEILTYTYASQTFTTAAGPNLVAARSYHGAATTPDGLVVLYGGQVSSSTVNTIEYYDPVANTFTAPSITLLAGVQGETAATLNNGLVLLAGGSSAALGSITEVSSASQQLPPFDPLGSTLISTSVGGDTIAQGNCGALALVGTGVTTCAGSVTPSAAGPDNITAAYTDNGSGNHAASNDNGSPSALNVLATLNFVGTVDTKTYDSTTNSALAATLSNPGALAGTDAVCAAPQTFDSVSVGTTHTLNPTKPSITIFSAAACGGVDHTANYFIQVTPSAATGVINKAPLQITANNQAKVYGATFSFVGTEFMITSGALFGTDSLTSATITSTGAAATATFTAPGPTYPINITPGSEVGSGLGNYTITENPGTMTLSQAPLSVTAKNQTKVYGLVFTFTGNEFTTSGLKNADTVTSATFFSLGAAATATVNGVGPTYSITITPGSEVGTGLGNYTITENPGTMTVTVAPLTITANSFHKAYGTTYTPTGTEFATTPPVLPNGDTISTVTLTSAGFAATATVPGGPYSIVPSAPSFTSGSAGNYSITFTNGVLTIDTAAITITANSFHKQYGNVYTPVGNEFTVTSGTVLNGDVLAPVTLTSGGFAITGSVVAPGPTYTITPSAAAGAGAGNYTITYATGTLTVDPEPLTLTGTNINKQYGLLYTPTGNEFTATAGTIFNGDAVGPLTVTSPTGFPATATVIAPGPTYPTTISAASGPAAGNYTITYVGGNITRTTAPITVTANSFANPYGIGYTPAGTEFGTTGTLYNGDTISTVTLTSAGFAATATVTAPGPTYPIVPSAANFTAGNAGNYNITYTNGTLTINKAPLTLTANTPVVHKIYGATFPFAGTEFAVTAGTLYNGDNVTSVTLTSAGAVATAHVVAPGPTYSIDITPASEVGPGVGNYTFTLMPGVLTVDPAPLSITPNPQVKAFGTTFSAFTSTVVGLQNGDGVTISYSSLGAPAGAAAGQYDINITSVVFGPGNAGDYTVTETNPLVNGLTVSNGVLTIVPDGGKTHVYGTTFSAFTGTVSGLQGTDAVTVTYTSAGAPGTAHVGAYDITVLSVNFTSGNPANYTNDFHTAVGGLTVTPAPLTITPDGGKSKVYGNTFSAFTGVVAGLQNSDAVTVNYTSAGAAGTALVGSYSISVAGEVFTVGNATDYTITPNTTANGLTVTQAPLTVTANNINKVAGTQFTFAGTEFTTSGLVNGDTVTSATIASAGSAIGAAAGQYPITITAAVGTGLTNYSITYVNGTMQVGQAPTTLTISGQLTVSTNASGGTLAFTVLVTSPDAGVPSGTVKITDNGNDISSGGVTLTNATATLTNVSLAAGSHTIMAVYSGDTNFLGGNASTSMNVNAFPGGSISAGTTGSAATVSFPVTFDGVGTINSATIANNTNVNPPLGCVMESAVFAVLPITTCTATLDSTLSNGQTGNLTIVINSTAGSLVGAARPQHPGSLGSLYSLSLAMPAVVFIGMAAPFATLRKRLVRRKVLAWIGLAMILCMLLLASGCGGGSFANPNKLPAVGAVNRTQAGAYTAVVQYKDANGNLQVLAAVPVTIN